MRTQLNDLAPRVLIAQWKERLPGGGECGEVIGSNPIRDSDFFLCPTLEIHLSFHINIYSRSLLFNGKCLYATTIAPKMLFYFSLMHAQCPSHYTKVLVWDVSQLMRRKNVLNWTNNLRLPNLNSSTQITNYYICPFTGTHLKAIMSSP